MDSDIAVPARSWHHQRLRLCGFFPPCRASRTGLHAPDRQSCNIVRRWLGHSHFWRASFHLGLAVLRDDDGSACSRQTAPIGATACNSLLVIVTVARVADGEVGVEADMKENWVMSDFNIGFVIFPGITQLDVTGPIEVLSRLGTPPSLSMPSKFPQSKTHVVAKTLLPVSSDR